MATEVVRESLRHFPISNTEVNFERLPRANALEGMELRYREESLSSSVAQPLMAFVALLIIGQMCAFGFRLVPEKMEWLWREAHSVEGMPVVGGMVVAIALLIALLSLVFIPHVIRVALATLTLPFAATSGAASLGQERLGYLAAGLAALLLCSICKPLLIAFHDSWLTADPRLTTVQAVAWKAKKKRGWTLPSIGAAWQVISRYLTHQAAGGIPGIWIAPSSLTTRVVISALMAGSIFATTAGSFEVVPGRVTSVAVSFVNSGRKFPIVPVEKSTTQDGSTPTNGRRPSSPSNVQRLPFFHIS